MKKLITLMLLATLSAQAQRIVGYFPSYRTADVNTVQYSKLTDVIYCFLNPQTNGSLNLTNTDATFGWDNATFTAVKAKCKPTTSTGPRLIVSVGGADIPGARAARLYDVASNPTYRATFVSELIAFAATHNLYGVDIDWEFPTTTAAKNAHETLLSALRTAINNSSNPNLKLGIAVGGEYSGSVNHLNYINTTAIQYVDDVNVMAYDFPTSYNADHSTRTDANASLNAWYTTKGVPKSKLLLGLPFYGWASPRGSTPSEYDQFSGYQTAYNSGLSGGYYYNSKATMEDKVSDVMAFGGQGVFIWDLGQDRADPWSYLSAIKTKMDAVCPAPQPDLGVDVNLCLPGTVVLDSKQDALSGRTFVWKKNGVVISGQTSPTTTVNSGGTYTVEITQSSCTKTDDIFVNSGSPLTVTGASRCGTGQVTLSATGGPYQWFDASTGGNLLTTASSYSPTISSTTTYYVQPNSGSTNYNGGKATINAPAAWNEAGYESSNSLPRYAHKVTISQNTTLVSVNAYYGSGVTINGAKIMIIASNNGTTIVDQTNPVNLPVNASPYTFTVNKVLAPGTYYIGVYAPYGGNSNPGIWLEPNTSYPSSQAGIFDMEGKCYANYGTGFNATQTPTHYGQLFGWVFAVGTVPACGRTPVTGTVTSAANQGLTVSGTTPICTGNNGNVSIQNSESSVSYQVFKGASSVSAASNGNGSTLNISIPSANLSAGDNTLTVKATASGCGAVDMTTQPVITVNSTPSQPGAFTNSSSTVCQNASSVAFSVPSVANTNYNWSYTGGTGATINGSGNAVTVDFNGSATSGSIEVTASNNCGTSTARTTAVTVNSVPAQPGAFTASTASVCQLTNGVTYTVPSSAGTFAWSYTTGSGATINGSGNSVTVDYSASATSGDLNVTVANSCGASVARTIAVTVNQRPDQPGAFTTSSSTVTEGQAGVVYTVPSVGGVTYTWSYSGLNATINGSSNSVSIDFAGNATSGDLTVSAAIGSCAAPSSRSMAVSVSPATSIVDLQKLQGGLAVYPNPFATSAVVSLNLESSSEVALSLFNSTGQEVLQLANGTLNSGEHNFSVSELPAGVYSIRMIKNGVVYNSKLIRQ